jgi:anti-sigma factor RsiW
MTAAEARELFSAAYERELDGPQAEAFAAALEADPELAREYEAFVATLGFARAGAVAPQVREPNLLPGVQRRLRARSRGRFYADRFSERLGGGMLQPLSLALVLLGLLALAWLAQAALSWIAVSPAP